MYSIEEALKKLSERIEYKRAVGYWRRGTTLIIHVEYENEAAKIPSYFIVSPGLPIRPTNPAKSALAGKDMIPID